MLSPECWWQEIFRNRLAVVGLVILASMFVFSFIGGLLAPYGETQVFKVYESVEKDYAGVSINNDYQYFDAEGETFPSVARAQLILAINKEKESFESGGVTYSLVKEGEDFYRVIQFQEVATVVSLKGINRFTAAQGETVSKEMEEAYLAASDAGKNLLSLMELLIILIKR